jgi:hypothetical protein
VDNDVSQFPEKLLQAWKTMAEHEALSTVGKTRPAPHESESQRKAREILKWKGQRVMLILMNTGTSVHTIGPIASSLSVHVLDCTEFYVRVVGDGWSESRSVPLKNIEIGFDDKDCLELQERNP